MADLARAAAQARERTREAGKTYAFDDGHDARRPAQTWYQESHEGTILFVVFYTLACRWARCLGCNLPSKMSSRHIGFGQIMAQVDDLLTSPAVRERRGEIRKLIASNNGSMLDESTFSSTALMYFMARLNMELSSLEVLTLETRPEHVQLAELVFIARALAEGPRHPVLELAVGFEAMDEHWRNGVIQKGLTLPAFERLVSEVAPFGVHIKCYFMLKPVPETDDEAAVRDVQAGIDYLSSLARRHGVSINLHLNPTYVAGGTPLETAFRAGRYRPPGLRDAARAVLHARGQGLSVFVGLYDEGLAVSGGSFLRPGEEGWVEVLERFNRDQDYAVLGQALAAG